MAEETNAGHVSGVEEAQADVKPGTRKQRATRRQKSRAEPAPAAKPTTAKTATAKTATAKRRNYSDQEKAEMLKQIEEKLSQGNSTLKAAVRSTGITEQTYYQWKRAAKATGQDEPVQAARKPSRQSDRRKAAPLPTGDELSDLVQLEEENRRLRKLLAKKLRQENSELRKRLGLD